MKLLIFNLDNSVFNIPNFNKVFLSKASPLNLFKNRVLFLTNKGEEAVKPLLEQHKEIHYTFIQYKAYSRKDFIRTQLKFWKVEEILAFGASEKDANIYSDSGIGFYIVSKLNGYPDVETILIEAVKERYNPWRNEFLYDHKFEVANYQLHTPSLEVVIYYKCYLDTKRYDKSNRLTGCDFAPEIDNRKPLKVFNQLEFGQTKKNINILHHLDSFAGLFKDIYIDNKIILVRVPGHDEVTYRSASPMSKLIARIIELHGSGVNGACFLKRNRVTVAAKEEERNSVKHLQTITVIDEAKELIKDRTIYLFDDICTSGSTMLACSHILKQAGARNVVCFCIAHTCTIGKLAPREIK